MPMQDILHVVVIIKRIEYPTVEFGKADLTKRVLSHANRNAARDGTEDEECINSCEDDTTSESESSDSDGENICVEESFEVLFCASGRHPTRKLGMRELMGGERGGVGVDPNIISRWGGGWLKAIFS